LSCVRKGQLYRIFLCRAKLTAAPPLHEAALMPQSHPVNVSRW